MVPACLDTGGSAGLEDGISDWETEVARSAGAVRRSLQARAGNLQGYEAKIYVDQQATP